MICMNRISFKSNGNQNLGKLRMFMFYLLGHILMILVDLLLIRNNYDDGDDDDDVKLCF